MENLKQSLQVARKTLNLISEITGIRTVELFNDSYRGKTRRIKFVFDCKEWIDRKDYERWNEVFKKLFNEPGYNVTFQPVNKLKSMGGKDVMEKNKLEYVKSGVGSEEEYLNKFNNSDVYFTIIVK